MPIPAFVTAGADQVLAAIRDAENMWPHNDVALNDGLVERAVLAAMRGPWETVQHGRSYLFLPAVGVARELTPGEHLPSLMLDVVPVRPSGCDRCGEVRTRHGWLLVTTPPHVVALSICTDCAFDLTDDYPALLWV